MRRRLVLSAGASALTACLPDSKASRIDGGFVGIDVARGHVLRLPDASALPVKTHRTQVLIAGGGVAGLAAARALRLRGIDDFALLELEDQAGGNSRAGAVNGLACPLGAHYLPVPSDSAPEVQDLLTELGLGQRSAGRWRLSALGEQQLCHSPQERLYFRGHWQEGLLPLADVGPQTLAQYQRFAEAVVHAQARAVFVIPVSKHRFRQYHSALDAITFDTWLNETGLTDPYLRWYLDYCCRDDYGAGLNTVSAWAGIHYFASRHGFHAPEGELASASPDRDSGVLTWPEGNGWLTRKMAAAAGPRLQTGYTVTRIEQQRAGVEVDALNAATGQLERWQADRCIVAMPLFVAARVLRQAPQALLNAAKAVRYAPWLVANVHIREPLNDRPGAPLSWDNVVHTESGSQQLGYVNATHQALSPAPGPTVLTHYRAFGTDTAQRQLLYERPWAQWRDTVLADLQVPHPDLAAKTTRIDVMRYGHAMAVPVPGFASHEALAALQASAKGQRLHFAHSDLSGYSVFEEAFAQGHRAGMTV
jgi:monoamine oxidase